MLLLCSRSSGSPPPTRGTRVKLITRWPYSRITPAYAGNTYTKYGLKRTGWDHPRLRGEHEKVIDLKSNEWGSPPPTRGTRFEYVPLLISTGITPAYAGNTELISITINISKDHPRLRGEHYRV